LDNNTTYDEFRLLNRTTALYLPTCAQFNQLKQLPNHSFY